MVSARQFADDLLHRLGAPVNTTSEELITAWTEKEGTKARFNPLATTQPMPGAGGFNGIGVRNYTSYQQGLDATVKTLRNGNYPTILTGLLLGDTQLATSKLSEFDKWGGSTRNPGAYSGSVMSLFRRAQSDWPAVGEQSLPSMPGAGSATTTPLPGGPISKKPGLSDIPGAIGGIASAGAGGLTGLLSDPLRQTIVFVTLLGGALGLILIGAKRTADPILPKVPPGAIAAMAA